MYDEMEVKYLFINLKYPAYVKLQIVLVIAWITVAFLLFLYARDSSVWLFRNGWWICPIIAVCEVGESLVAIKKAKEGFPEANLKGEK